MGAFLGSVASGLMGMIGANAAQQNAEAMQNSVEAYNTQMADTQYQRGMADMKAAGLNPMLAYMQGGDSAPTAPTYQPSTPLQQLSDPLLAMGKAVDQIPMVEAQQESAPQTVIKATADARAGLAMANSAETQASLQNITAPLTVAQQVARTSEDQSEAFVAAQTRYNNIAASAADVKQKQAQADQAVNDASVSDASVNAQKNVAGINPYVDTTAKIIGGAASAIDAGAAVSAARAFVKGGNQPYTSTRNGMIYHKGTGEIAPSMQ